MSELAHGLLLQEQGRLEEAESCFLSVLAGDPENAFVYSRLALCQLSQEGRLTKALHSINEAIRIEADNGYFHSVKSLILSDLRHYKEALAAAGTAIALNPEDALALVTKANAYCGMSRWAGAEEWSRRSLVVDSDHTMAANILTHALRMQGKSAENEVAVEQLLAADPENSYAHTNAGWSALQGKDHEAAEAHFREALRLDPSAEVARGGLIESFKARSRFYRLYLSYSFFMQRFTGGKQWMIIIGLYVAYQIAGRLLEKISPLLAGSLALVWLGFVMWIWLAPGIGNFLILLDRSARLALKGTERRQGIAVGGAILAALAAMAFAWGFGWTPAWVVGLGLLLSTVPASLAFDNESSAGRRVFGAMTGFVYLSIAVVAGLESFRIAEAGFHPLSVGLGLATLVVTVACTWMGNIPGLRQEKRT
ncbi:MAG: tetratricopeptide repeat protein [Verrucomicrobiales bacterium]|nr:tetratricopeptide repeat protein [Verrucomicrobiales bacterium]